MISAAALRASRHVDHLSAHSAGLSPFAIATGSRRYLPNCYRQYNAYPGSYLQNAANRIYRNVSRIYARRILEIAAASVAVQRFVAELESRPKPEDWKNWKRKEWSQELLHSLGDSTLQRLWAATKRVVSLAALVAPLAILYPLSLLSTSTSEESVSWKYALWGIEQAGPTYIKLVQWATTRQDLFSPEFCRYFGKLRDDATTHSWTDTVQILQEELELPVKDAEVEEYLDLNPKPIGSGCIAQVYHGTLKQPVGKYDQGTEVAVKVQHPGIWQKVCVDFYIMGIVAQWLEALPYLNLKFLSVSDSVRQFRDIMLPQLDLTLEAKHLQRFNRDFAGDTSVTFPHPLDDLTNTRVLTETFVHGTPILNYVDATEDDRYQLAQLGLTTTLRMIFLNDFLHG